jgi:hypothetical protein
MRIGSNFFSPFTERLSVPQRFFPVINALFAVIFLFSCTQKSDFLKGFSGMKAVERKGEIVLNPETFGILKPWQLFFMDSLFVIKDIGSEHILHVIDPGSGKAVHGIRKGNGPNEIVSLGSIEAKNGKIYIYDIARKIIYRMNPQSSISDSVMHYEEYLRLSTEYRPFLLNVTGRGILATGLFEEGVFMYMNPESGESHFSVDYPEFENTAHLEKMEKAALYLSKQVTVKPDETGLACAYSDVGVISFCRLEKHTVSEYRKIIYFGSEFMTGNHPGQPAVVYKKGNKTAFCSIASTDKYVYVTYSGRSFETHKNEAVHECEYLLVYDWEGNPVKYYHLDIPLFDFSLDAAGHVIYGISLQPEGVIVKYSLD